MTVGVFTGRVITDKMAYLLRLKFLQIQMASPKSGKSSSMNFVECSLPWGLRNGHKTKLDRMNLYNGIFKVFDKCKNDAPELVIERVQRAMLSALERYCEAIDQSLDTRISRAKDLDDLWYLRPNLMRAISVHKGEQIALGVLSDITRLFQWPDQKASLARS